MTREEIERLADDLRARRDDGWVYGTVKTTDGLELCRLALIGEQAERLEAAIQAAMMADAPVRKDDDVRRD